jgi:predicted RNA binding protein YcfA (HicA-like mRNA interferase family)
MRRIVSKSLSHPVATVAEMQAARLLECIRRGSVGNIDFGDLVRLVMALGFREIGGRGSHRVFARTGVRELVNLQAEKGQAKPYQVRQIATLVRRYDLHLEDET